MSEETPDREQPAVEATDAVLAKKVRRLKVWVIVLTVIVCVQVVASAASLAFTLSAYWGAGASGITVSDEELSSTRSAFQKGLGSRITSIDVRPVTLEYGAAPFPYSLFSGGSSEERTYVECHLKGGVVIADTVPTFYGYDAGSSGMIPMQGSLASRMTEDEFDLLVAAYAAESDAPIGSVRRYNDQTDMMYTGTAVPETVKVTGADYPASELWRVTTGRLVEGDSIDLTKDSGMREALIFHEDPETGEFTFLGTESAPTPW